MIPIVRLRFRSVTQKPVDLRLELRAHVGVMRAILEIELEIAMLGAAHLGLVAPHVGATVAHLVMPWNERENVAGSRNWI